MILVTGGTGFIGSHLVDRLIERKQSFRILARRPGSVKNAAVSRGDLATGEGIAEALDGVDSVIHLAGATKTLTPEGYRLGNVVATENLARAIAKAGRPIRVVHVSSLAAVGPAPDGAAVTENDEPGPVSLYGKSKLEGERRMRAHVPEAAIIRPPVVYGPRDTDVFQILKSASKGLALRIAGRGRASESWFSAIYVSDLVEGILLAEQSPAAAEKTWFLAHPRQVSFTEMIAAIAQAIGRTPRIVTIPPAAAFAAGSCAEAFSRLTGKPGILSRDKVREMVCARWVCSTERARRELAFEASTDFAEGIERSIAWYRTAGWLR
ncbi:MAG TPA: NAD-dependent epimerase/dehydratase family protein [Bryobacteraceae bacterium]|nr:NAD-dependent epimerase/dehydratase family protein [Bryobacteraceae bacterium]